MSLRSQISALMDPLRRRILLMIGRALITAISDESERQVVQLSLLKDEIKEDVERLQQYGFSSVPVEGAEALVAFIGGNKDHAVVISADNPSTRKKGLKAGDSCLYHKDGHYILLTDGDKIQVIGENIEVTGSNIKLGEANFKKLVNEEFQALFENHIHLIKTAGSPAAQTGVSSSPASVTGGTPPGPVKVAAVAPDPLTFLFNDDMTSSQFTDDTEAG